MKVAVVNLTSGGLSGGYRKYLSRLMPLLAGDRRITALTLFVPPGLDAALDSRLDLRTWTRADARRGYADLKREIARLKPDVVFVPTARSFACGSIPVVTMVRNMEPLAAPFAGHALRERIRNIARAWEARRACRRAAAVIAVSNYVRDFIVKRWGIESSRVGIVYHGVDTPAVDTTAMGLTPPQATLFTAGSIRPARGLSDLIRALPLTHSDVTVAIAGRLDHGCEAYGGRLRRLARDLGVAHRVTWTGQLTQDQMTQGFGSCAAFVMTSRAEACPNTVLEAMSYGCASVAVDHPPMPEFFGDAAVYYRAGDAAALASRVETLITDSDSRDRLQAAARLRAASFTWQHTCERTIGELQRAVL